MWLKDACSAVECRTGDSEAVAVAPRRPPRPFRSGRPAPSPKRVRPRRPAPRPGRAADRSLLPCRKATSASAVRRWWVCPTPPRRASVAFGRLRCTAWRMMRFCRRSQCRSSLTRATMPDRQGSRNRSGRRLRDPTPHVFATAARSRSATACSRRTRRSAGPKRRMFRAARAAAGAEHRRCSPLSKPCAFVLPC